MKLRSIHIILIIILVVAIFMITSSDSVVPYSRDTLFSNMYKYEGMKSHNTPESNPDAAKLFENYVNQNAQKPDPLSESDFNAAISDINKETHKKPEGFGMNKKHHTPKKSKDPKKVEGFALQPAPFGDYQVLDRFSQTPSDPQCFGKSSGYSNSLGALCLSKEDARLLSTRGGNISGTDSTIGY
jgi:lipopolysaccharide export LptBFGC system permease protein LptF